MNAVQLPNPKYSNTCQFFFASGQSQRRGNPYFYDISRSNGAAENPNVNLITIKSFPELLSS